MPEEPSSSPQVLRRSQHASAPTERSWWEPMPLLNTKLCWKPRSPKWQLMASTFPWKQNELFWTSPAVAGSSKGTNDYCCGNTVINIKSITWEGIREISFRFIPRNFRHHQRVVTNRVVTLPSPQTGGRLLIVVIACCPKAGDRSRGNHTAIPQQWSMLPLPACCQNITL